MGIAAKLKLYLLVQTAVLEAESKYHEKIALRVFNDFLNMPDSIYKIMEDDYKEEPESMAYSVALEFADYEYEMFAGDLQMVPKVHSIDWVLSSWLMEYIKWKPKKTRQDEEVLIKITEWESSK